jgi:hypothetical protein
MTETSALWRGAAAGYVVGDLTNQGEDRIGETPSSEHLVALSVHCCFSLWSRP